MNKNIEVRMLVFRPNGTFKSLILEETKSKNKGKDGDKPTIPKFKVMQIDKYFITT